MAEPTTINRGLIIPLTGDLPGTWGSGAINPDMAAIDGMLGGFVTISLAASPVTLSMPAGFTATPGAGPVQSQNSMIIFTGTLTAAVTVTFPMPGYYIVNNLCTVGAYYVKLASSSPGNVICAPPGEAVHVFCDGTNMYYVNLARIGSYLDLAASTVPTWITNCTVHPYLNCDGSAFSSITYPTLNSLLGGTTLPDLRGRSRAALNQGTGRITTAGSGVDGNTLLAAGGAETITLTAAQLASHAHPITDVQHNHASGPAGYYVANATANIAYGGSGLATPIGMNTLNTSSSYTGITATNSNTGGDNPHSNLQPTQMAGLTLIRAG